MISGYQPRLDGVRAIAILMVLEHHFTTRLWLGSLGVRLFFVLSGYLISRIIFTYRNRGISIPIAARQFYWRRAVRLAPPLYLAIAIAYILNVSDMRQDWIWHALYLSNVQVYLDNAFGPAGMFWTLAVEEQFYLVWFFVLIATPVRWALPVIIGGIFIGTVFKLIAAIAGGSLASVLLPGAIDYFCLGALIAYAEFFRPTLDYKFRAWMGNPFAVTVFGVIVAATLVAKGGLAGSLNDIAEGIFSFCVVTAARNGSDGWYLNWLSYPILRHIGKISYGIYVYHQFVRQILAHYGVDLILRHSIGAAPLKLGVEFGLTFLVAELSWRFVEKPIMRLKPLVSARSELVDPERRSVGVNAPG